LKKFLLIQGLLVQSLLLISSEFESIDNILSNQLDKPLILGLSHGNFDQSLDILNYADKLKSTKPKTATTDTLYFSYKFKKLKISYESFESSGTVERLTQPKSLTTDVDGDSIYLSYDIYETDNNNLELGLFSKEEKQDPVIIDCYAFGSTVIGGACDEAKLRVLDSAIYRASGDLVYEPVLETAGESDSKGIYLRISPKSLSLLDLTHTFSYKISTISQSYSSAILNTTDTFIRGLTIDGRNAGELLDQFKLELPQETPWKENTFKYSASSLIPIGDRFGLSLMYSFIKVKRDEYLSNPNKDDFTKNHLLDLSVFYKANDYGILYLKFSASTNYLLGENPLAYNRRSSHLFDHPYGQVNAGLIINF